MFTLFTQPGCGPCNGVASMLRAKKLAHTVIDIREDSAARKRMESLGGKRTPFVVNESTGETWGMGEDTRFFARPVEKEHPRAGRQEAA